MTSCIYHRKAHHRQATQIGALYDELSETRLPPMLAIVQAQLNQLEPALASIAISSTHNYRS
ncbi:hypothetical protein S7335_4077 [Synechococcus sp. PCC 7335]|nr:hypothetical protein S7335_4077 [Synechococcus sp. PCC 7335]